MDTKSDRSPVTIADRSAEQAMRAVLAERFPDHGVLGEEFGLDRPEARLRWVLDPIDGTRAFVSGRPTFGTLIALLDGETPDRRRDRPAGDAASAGSAPSGAAPCSAARMAAVPAAGRARHWPMPNCPAPVPRCSVPTCRAGSAWCCGAANYWGGDCYAHGLLALGQIDVITECTMNLWDWAALVPVVEGAGGRVTDWCGQALRLGW